MTTMQATIHERYGSPALLRVGALPVPALPPDRVRIRVHAAGVNAADGYTVRGAPFPVRAMAGLRRPRNPVPGMDVAGVVEAVGERITRFRPGDEVVGWAAGSFAEQAIAREDRLTHKPGGLGWVDAAALPLAATTALQGLRDPGRLQSGQRVLIVGASGGVGSYAVQIAHAMGGVVSAVCREANTDLVRSLGAQEVIAYDRQDWTAAGRRFDLVFQLAGRHGPGVARRVLAPTGTLVLSSGQGRLGGVDRILGAALRNPFARQRLVALVAHDSVPDLDAVLAMVAAGTVRSAIDRTWPLEAAAEAVAHVAAGHTRGKTVIAVRP
jgi:NADPH:quinone reductase-like Zn-dependent oxidoreductase